MRHADDVHIHRVEIHSDEGLLRNLITRKELKILYGLDVATYLSYFVEVARSAWGHSFNHFHSSMAQRLPRDARGGVRTSIPASGARVRVCVSIVNELSSDLLADAAGLAVFCDRVMDRSKFAKRI